MTDWPLLNTKSSSDDDWLLQQIVTTVATHEDAEFGVTLSVAGVVITGRLISAKRFYSLFGAQIASRLDASPAEAEQIRSRYVNLAERNDETLRKRWMEAAPPRFFYLSNARIISGYTAIPRGDGMLWRGKLSEVNGWSLAEFEF